MYMHVYIHTVKLAPWAHIMLCKCLDFLFFDPYHSAITRDPVWTQFQNIQISSMNTSYTFIKITPHKPPASSKTAAIYGNVENVKGDNFSCIYQDRMTSSKCLHLHCPPILTSTFFPGHRLRQLRGLFRNFWPGRTGFALISDIVCRIISDTKIIATTRIFIFSLFWKIQNT